MLKPRTYMSAKISNSFSFSLRTEMLEGRRDGSSFGLLYKAVWKLDW